MRMGKHEADNNTHILTKLILCQMAFKSKVDQVLDNPYNAFFRGVNLQVSTKGTALTAGEAALKCSRRLF